MSTPLPEPHLTLVHRPDATVDEPLELGASADWQTMLPNGTALGDIRYTLQTDAGAVLYVQSRGVRCVHRRPRARPRA